MNKHHHLLNIKRNSSIELLRIISMLFIVLSHSSVHGNFPTVDSEVTINNYFLDFFVLGNLGVNIFMMISGYFLCMKKFKIDSAIRLLSQVYFYSGLGLVVWLLLGNPVSVEEFLTCIFPTIFCQYWFFTAYIAILLLSPFINVFINNSSQKQLLSCCLIMLVLWSVLPTFTTRSIYGSELPQFLMFYLLGAYLKKYPNNVLSIPKFSKLLASFSAVLLFTSSIILRTLNKHIYMDVRWLPSLPVTFFYSRTSILVIGLALGMVSIAVNHKSYSNRIINLISSCTFGVYLLHDNSFIRRILWPVWLNNDAFYNSPTLIARILLSVAVVYAVCTFFDIMRQMLCAQPIEYLVAKVYSSCFRAVKKIFYFSRSFLT